MSSIPLYALLLTSVICCAASIPDQDPEELLQMVIESALPEGPEGKTVYVSKQPLVGGTAIGSWESAYVVPVEYDSAWFFFIDDIPEANWEHPCRYVFVDVESGGFQVLDAKTPPDSIADLIRLYPKE